MIKRQLIQSVIQQQKHDASSTNNTRGMAKRAKRYGNKKLRLKLKREVKNGN